MRLLRDEERRWYPSQIEEMVQYMMNCSIYGGDLSQIAYKLQAKLRDIPDWTKQVRRPLKMLENLLIFPHRYHLKMTAHNDLIQSLLAEKGNAITKLFVKPSESVKHMSTYHRWYIAKKL